MSCCVIYILLYNFLLYGLFWRPPIWGRSQKKGYIKNQYIPQLNEERMALYSSVNQGMYGHMARAQEGRGRVPSIFLGYV
jgi:hypothetical protein